MSGTKPIAEMEARFSRMKARIKLDVNYLEHDRVMEFVLLGLPRNAFDRQAKPKLEYLAHELDLSMAPVKAIDFEWSSDNHAVVMTTQGMEINRALYETVRYSTELTCRSRFGSFSDKLISLDLEIYNNVTGSLLLRNSRRLVFVSGMGQVLPLSEGFKSKLKGIGAKQIAHSRVQQPAPSRDCYVYHLKVGASDMDHQLHVNQAVYLKFCLDAAYEAGMARKLPQFKGDIAEFDVKKAVMLYRGQAVAGDKLEVRVWEDQSEPLTLHFLTSKQGTPINMTTLSYYGDQAKL